MGRRPGLVSPRHGGCSSACSERKPGPKSNRSQAHRLRRAAARRRQRASARIERQEGMRLARRCGRRHVVPAVAAARGSRRRPFFSVEALPAGHGDCLWIEYGDGANTHRLLIDCGTQATSKALLAAWTQVPAERALPRAVRPVAHRFRSHRRGAAFFKAVKRGPALRRRLVQRLAARVGTARRAAGGDVLDGDPGFRAAVERLAQRQEHRSWSTATICRRTCCRAA